MHSHPHFSTHSNKCPIGDHVFILPRDDNVSIGGENGQDTHLVGMVGWVPFNAMKRRCGSGRSQKRILFDAGLFSFMEDKSLAVKEASIGGTKGTEEMNELGFKDPAYGPHQSCDQTAQDTAGNSAAPTLLKLGAHNAWGTGSLELGNKGSLTTGRT